MRTISRLDTTEAKTAVDRLKTSLISDLHTGTSLPKGNNNNKPPRKYAKMLWASTPKHKPTLRLLNPRAKHTKTAIFQIPSPSHTHGNLQSTSLHQKSTSGRLSRIERLKNHEKASGPDRTGPIIRSIIRPNSSKRLTRQKSRLSSILARNRKYLSKNQTPKSGRVARLGTTGQIEQIKDRKNVRRLSWGSIGHLK
jgi:hypothetical protein